MNFNGAAAAPREIDGASSEATAAEVNVRRLIMRQIPPDACRDAIMPPRSLHPVYWDYRISGKVGGAERPGLTPNATASSIPERIPVFNGIRNVYRFDGQ